MRHPDVDALLTQLLSAIKPALSDNFLALYIGGSLATGAFNPDTSDVNLVVLTHTGISDQQATLLKAAHDRVSALPSKWATKLEILYIPLTTLHTRESSTDPCAYLGVGGWFNAGDYQTDWIVQLHLIREHGIVVEGPDSKSLIPPITSDALRSSVAGIFRQNWEPLLQDTSRFDAEYQAYAVLTMCRLLYTHTHGAIATKPQAAHWAKPRLPPRWSSMIDAALTWRPGLPFDHLPEVLALLRHTLTTVAPASSPPPPPPHSA